MMTAERTDNYRPILSECFLADKDLLELWHIYAGKGLNACLEKTFRDLQTAAVIFFTVMIHDELVGYFGKELCDNKEFLTGFFIMPDLRTNEIRTQFWSLVKAQFELPFHCGLYEKNVPANRFIISRGGKEIERVALPDGKAIHYVIGA
jgi:hypothetical protein